MENVRQLLSSSTENSTSTETFHRSRKFLAESETGTKSFSGKLDSSESLGSFVEGARCEVKIYFDEKCSALLSDWKFRFVHVGLTFRIVPTDSVNYFCNISGIPIKNFRRAIQLSYRFCLASFCSTTASTTSLHSFPIRVARRISHMNLFSVKLRQSVTSTLIQTRVRKKEREIHWWELAARQTVLFSTRMLNIHGEIM